MAKRRMKTKQADRENHRNLLASLTESIRAEVMRELDVVVKKVSESVRSLEERLSGGGNGRRGRRLGRTAGRGSLGGMLRQGRESGISATGRIRRKGGNAPRGALKAATLEVMQKTGKPMALKDIAAAVLATPLFKGRNPKSVYNKMNTDLSKNPKVKRISKGVYVLKK